MSFWSAPFKIFSKKGGLFNSIEDDTTTETTAASYNINPMTFDITAKPMVEIIPNNFVNEPPPVAVQNMINKVLNSLIYTNDGEMEPTENEASVSSSTMDIPDKNGHTLVKIIEDMTGKTVEVINEATTMVTSEALDSSEGSQILGERGDNTSYVDVYIITALILLILMTMSIAIVVWCRRNKIKSVKRNAGKYPIGREYNNDQKISNAEKPKDVP